MEPMPSPSPQSRMLSFKPPVSRTTGTVPYRQATI